MVLSIDNYTNILNELNKAVKAHRFYPEGHPNLRNTLEACYLSIKNVTTTSGEATFSVTKNSFLVGGAPILEGNTSVAALAKDLFVRRIEKIILTENFSITDIEVLFTILNSDYKELTDRGGIPHVLAEGGASGLLLNETDYNELQRLQTELEVKKREEEISLEETGGNLESADKDEGEEGAEGEEEVYELNSEDAAPEDTTEDQSLDSLLELLENEENTERYETLAGKILNKTESAINNKYYDISYIVLKALLKHSADGSEKPSPIKDVAATTLDKLLATHIVPYLLEILVATVEEKDTVTALILRCDDRAIELLLQELIISEDREVRHVTLNLLADFGTRVLGKATDLLFHEQWYISRQMASLLGKVADPSSIHPLIKAYENNDTRVKKEILKALSQIEDPTSASFLVTALKEKDKTLQLQAILSLSVLRDSAAVEPLGEIAMKKDIFSNVHVTTKEAIKALGIIGTESAVHCLYDIIHRKVFFNKGNYDEAKVLAATSLGVIGTEKAITILQNYLPSTSGVLHNTCKRIIDGSSL